MNAGHLCHQDHADILKATFNRITGLVNFLVVAAADVVVVVVAVDVECSFETQVVFRNSEKNDFGPTCPVFSRLIKNLSGSHSFSLETKAAKTKKRENKNFLHRIFFSLNTRKLGNEK